MKSNSIYERNVILNREIGLIQFYSRVLAKSTDTAVPLLERLGYLCIVSRNCDELFEVRIARLLKLGKEEPKTVLPDGLVAMEALKLVRNSIITLYDEIYTVYHKHIIPELRHKNIFILERNEWNEQQQAWIHDYFMHELKPILTPISIDPSHPFPRVPNKNLHFAVELRGKDQFGRNSRLAIVEAPRILPRVIKLPVELSDNKEAFILLQDVIKIHVNEFFYGLDIRGCYPFRVTRAADIVLKTNPKNLRSAVSKEVQNRKYAECSRLELDVTDGKPTDSFINILLRQFSISKNELYLANGPVNISRIDEISHMVDYPELRFAPFTPGTPSELINETDIFKAMDKSDILIHSPYQSFDPVLELTQRAANDPTVLAIKMTVYRTGYDSELVQNLVKAAQAGKQVIASIELFARFDEEINVELANQLEEAGAHVVYGVMGYKVHAKMLLIIRKEDNNLKHYAHLGTGNYHQSTAKTYTDFGLLTTNPEITQDVDNLFAQITGVGRAGMLNCLLQAPFTLFDHFIKLIDNEVKNVKENIPGMIIAKMNSLLEPQIIEALYNASCAGVKIILIVRGACALRPNVIGLSENIQVKSIVGRFLEHERIFYFYANGKEELYLSSADWMKRNFFRRVETCVPILDPKIKNRIIEEGLKLYIQDNSESWNMQADGSYTRHVGRGRKICAQQRLLKKLSIQDESNQ